MPKCINREGETLKAKNGLMMTIIVYRSTRDIDIQFEDGYVIEHINYSNFLTGKVRHPDHSALLKPRIGETKIAHNGMRMEIIAYRGVNDIDVRFEDSTEVLHKTYGSFRRGEIANPSKPTLLHPERFIGKSSVANNGLKMTIVEYRGSDDIDIQFEDGVMVSHKSYRNFLVGGIAHPNINAKAIRKAAQYIGKTSLASNGMQMRIIAYRSKVDIDVQFEDGVIVTGVRLNNFLVGRIKHPTDNRMTKILHTRVGESGINTQGLKMQIVSYRSANDMDIMFEDQTITYHKAYNAFKKGNIKYIPASHCGIMSIEDLAYVFNNIGNFYCRCTKCGHKDIMTIPEMKSHICNI